MRLGYIIACKECGDTGLIKDKSKAKSIEKNHKEHNGYTLIREIEVDME